MPRKSLTSRFCESVSVDVRTDFQDEHIKGLVLRVSPEGSKTWCAIYPKEGGGKVRLKLGTFPALTLERARAAALKAMSEVAEGGDPGARRKASRDGLTVRQLGERFIERYAKARKRTWQEDERLLEREVYRHIGTRKVDAVKRRDILDIIDGKADAGKFAQSRQLLAVMRKMFAWAVENDYVAASPAAGIKARGAVVRRDRVLSDEELRRVWRALPEAAISDAMRDIFRLLLLTGQRSGEVCGMRRDEIDAESREWHLPAERTKNGRAHLVPLSVAALEIIEGRIAKARPGKIVPLFARVEDPIEPNAVAQACRKALQILDEPWTPHDLRRTCATGMAKLGIPPHIIEAVLNHVSGFRAGVAGTYNRFEYQAEKTAALDAWASHVADVIANRASSRKNVIAFPGRRA